MTKREFSSKILRVSYHHWRYVLSGERNLSLKKARLVAELLNTDVLVWLDQSKLMERQTAWQKFSSQ